MANQHVKRCFTELVIRQMQKNKTTMQFYYAPTSSNVRPTIVSVGQELQGLYKAGRSDSWHYSVWNNVKFFY